MNDIDKIANYLMLSKNAMVLTGAGISTESGIPDFRTRLTGIWTKLDPALICYTVLKDEPEVFYKNFKLFAQMTEGRQPNTGHRIVAELEQMGIIKGVLTQNIDGFHTLAGSKNVLEMHGNFKNSYCMKCGSGYPYHLIQNELDKDNFLPLSPCCGATLRPSVVLFGDQLPMAYHQFEANDLMNVDFLLVMGTSLEVYPVANLPKAVGDYAIINKGKTKQDYKAKAVIHDSIGNTLDRLLCNIKSRVSTLPASREEIGSWVDQAGIRTI